MMMTQQFSGGSFDHFYRTNSRSLAHQQYQDRNLPYQPYHGHHERSELAGRPVNHAMIHDPEQELANGQARKRIPVACARCRRRKIKCSGDPGDGSGCQACRASGADINACTFERVGTVMELYPRSSSTTAQLTPTYDQSQSTSFGSAGSYAAPPRPQVPALQTRLTRGSYGAQFDESPVDQYNYSPIAGLGQRQDSLMPGYGYTTGPHSAALPASYYEPSNSNYTFGNLQSSYPPTGSFRFATSTDDGFSALNMTSLHSSLPTPHARRLPVPPIPAYQQSTYSNVEVPDIRPLAAPRMPIAHINGVHSRQALPWSTDSISPASRQNSINSLAPLSHTSGSSSGGSEPGVLGYQIPPCGLLQTPDSPNASPTTTSNMSSSYQSTAMPSSSFLMQPPGFRYSTSSSTGLPPLLAEELPRSRLDHPAPLYSFSADTADRSGPPSDTMRSADGATADGHSYAQIRQLQPQHAASVEALRRQSSFDQAAQQQRRAGHRASASSLNTRY